MKRNRPFLLCFPLFLLIFSCNECNDCLDLQQKNILILDSDGNNLLFGDNAILNISNVELVSGGQNVSQLLQVDDSSQSLYFFIEEDQTTYILRLEDTNSVTIEFDLGERKSERCCGNQIYSTSTRVNGITVDNSDTITIFN